MMIPGCKDLTLWSWFHPQLQPLCTQPCTHGSALKQVGTQVASDLTVTSGLIAVLFLCWLGLIPSVTPAHSMLWRRAVSFHRAGRYEYVYAVFSPQLSNTRDLVVYLPPSYDENSYKVCTCSSVALRPETTFDSPLAASMSACPHLWDVTASSAANCCTSVWFMQFFDTSSVLVMHDGQNLFNVSTSSFGTAWMCQNTVDALVVQGSMSEVSRSLGVVHYAVGHEWNPQH